MTLSALLHALEATGIKLSLKLGVKAPRSALTPELVDALAEHKPLLLIRLAREAQWEVLRHQRWGPALGGPTSGVVIPE